MLKIILFVTHLWEAAHKTPNRNKSFIAAPFSDCDKQKAAGTLTFHYEL